MVDILIEHSLSINNYYVKCAIIPLHKSYLILITDQQQYGIGNILLSFPPKIEGLNPLSSTSPLFGVNERIIEKIISELSTVKLKKPCLTISFFKDIDQDKQEKSKIILTCLKQALVKIEEKKNQNRK
ncbi:MAG: hypothetical protein ACTSRZ_00030 [Promethearchaeota archaeon]